jgi:hypothetical protein
MARAPTSRARAPRRRVSPRPDVSRRGDGRPDTPRAPRCAGRPPGACPGERSPAVRADDQVEEVAPVWRREHRIGPQRLRVTARDRERRVGVRGQAREQRAVRGTRTQRRRRGRLAARRPVRGFHHGAARGEGDRQPGCGRQPGCRRARGDDVGRRPGCPCRSDRARDKRPRPEHGTLDRQLDPLSLDCLPRGEPGVYKLGRVVGFVNQAVREEPEACVRLRAEGNPERLVARHVGRPGVATCERCEHRRESYAARNATTRGVLSKHAGRR